MKNELKQAIIATKATLIVLWPVSAYAAQLTFGEQMSQIPMLSLLMTVILSTIMGATALLHSMTQEYQNNEDGDIPHLGLFIATRMLSSNAAGLLLFFGAESWDIPIGYRAGAIMLGAFGGTYTIQRLLHFFANKFTPEHTT